MILRLWFVLLMPLFGATLLLAQPPVQAIGKIDKAELELTDCSFDKGAAALKLVDRRHIFYTKGENVLKMVANRQTRIKIFNNEGLGYANVRIPYITVSDNEKINNIKAYTYNLGPNGTVTATKVDKKSIFVKKVNKNINEIIIAFPMAKAGSVIEYSYTLERNNIGYIEDWYFQDEIPVLYSEFELRAPLLFKFREDAFIYAKVEKEEALEDELLQVDGTTRRIKTLQKKYVMRNLPGIQDEPFITSKNDYRQRISLQLAQTEAGNGMTKDIRTTWEDVVTRLNEDEDFGEELRKNIPAAAAVIADAVQHPDTLSRMVKIFNVVRNSMDWNGSLSPYALSGVRTAWENKIGSSGDINIILINLLRQAGVSAEPMLVSTRSNGTVNINYPSERQFNTVMAFVPIGPDFYVLDATDKYTAWQLIPYAACNTWGLRLRSENNHQWVELLPHQGLSEVTVIQATMDAAGVMQGDATINSYHYAKTPRSKMWLQDEADFLSTYIIGDIPNITINQLEVLNADNDSLPLEQKIRFTLPLNSSGGYTYFPPHLFFGLDENPFTSDERKSDIDFGCRQEYTLHGSFTIPENHVFETPVSNFLLRMPDTSIIFSMNRQAEDNLLRVRMSVQFKQSYYLASNYPALQDFFKKIFAKLNEPIVIRKK